MASYEKLAHVYDTMMADVPYDDWIDYLNSIWKRLGKEPKSLLDLCCGTGTVSALLSKRGLAVTGIDLSRDMLEVAKKKDDTIRFVQADMRTFAVEEPVDAVICLYDSINYLLSESDIQDTFRAVNKALKPGGTFVFDMNTVFKLLSCWKAPSLCVDYPTLHVCEKATVDPETVVAETRVDVFVKRGDLYERFAETHAERAYALEFVQHSLRAAGFKVAGCWDASGIAQRGRGRFDFSPPHERSDRVYFAAIKR